MNTSDLRDYRRSASEQQRVGYLLGMLPVASGLALDVGARDGYLSIKLVDRGLQAQRSFEDPTDSRSGGRMLAFTEADRVRECARSAPSTCHRSCFSAPARSWHGCPAAAAHSTCLARRLGANHPLRQNRRHVPREFKAVQSTLFPQCRVGARHFVGQTRDATNALAATLLNLRSNPGTYEQTNPCIHRARPRTCEKRSILQRLETSSAQAW